MVSDCPMPTGVKRFKFEKETHSGSEALRRTLESGFLDKINANESVKLTFSEHISQLTDVFLFESLPEVSEKTEMMHSLLRARSDRNRLCSQCKNRKEFVANILNISGYHGLASPTKYTRHLDKN
jgi:hypothetical protein